MRLLDQLIGLLPVHPSVELKEGFEEGDDPLDRLVVQIGDVLNPGEAVIAQHNAYDLMFAVFLFEGSYRSGLIDVARSGGISGDHHRLQRVVVLADSLRQPAVIGRDGDSEGTIHDEPSSFGVVFISLPAALWGHHHYVYHPRGMSSQIYVFRIYPSHVKPRF